MNQLINNFIKNVYKCFEIGNEYVVLVYRNGERHLDKTYLYKFKKQSRSLLSIVSTDTDKGKKEVEEFISNLDAYKPYNRDTSSMTNYIEHILK